MVTRGGGHTYEVVSLERWQLEGLKPSGGGHLERWSLEGWLHMGGGQFPDVVTRGGGHSWEVVTLKGWSLEEMATQRSWSL